MTKRPSFEAELTITHHHHNGLCFATASGTMVSEGEAYVPFKVAQAAGVVAGRRYVGSVVHNPERDRATASEGSRTVAPYMVVHIQKVLDERLGRADRARILDHLEEVGVATAGEIAHECGLEEGDVFSYLMGKWTAGRKVYRMAVIRNPKGVPEATYWASRAVDPNKLFE